MVIPLNHDEDETTQHMLRLTKQTDGSLSREEFGDCKFVPMLKAIGRD